MAITLVTGPVVGDSGGGFSNTVTLTLTGVTAGNSIVAGAVWNDYANTLDSVSCTSESNLTRHTLIGDGTTVGAHRFASLAQVTTSGTKTIVFTWSSNHSPNQGAAFAMEVAGGDTSSFFASQNHTTTTGTTPSTSVTTSTDSSLLVSTVFANTGVSTITPDAGYTAVALAGALKEAAYDLDVGSAGSKTVGYTLNTSATSTVTAAVFNAMPPGSDGTFDKSLPAVTVYADTGETIGVGEFSLPQFTVFAQDQNNVSLPQLTLSASAPSGELGGASGILPMFTVSGEGVPGNSSVAVLPAMTVEAGGVDGPGGESSSSLPALVAAAVGVTEGLAAASIALPALAVSADDGGGAGIVAPLMTVSASGETGWDGRFGSALPLLAVSASGGTDGVAAGAPLLPALAVSGASSSGEVGAASVALRVIRIESAGQVGTTSTGVISVPRFRSSASGTTPSVASAAAELPAFFVNAAGSAALANVWRTWVLNLHTRALSEYTGFQFNSYARFAGHVLAASSGGIFKLDTTKNDAGVSIASVVRTGVHDYDSSWLKRIPRLYVNYSTTGDVEVRTITSEDGRRRYLLPHNNVAGVQQRRVPVGKGPKSRYWQFEVANRDGADFALSSIVVYPTELRRRSQ